MAKLLDLPVEILIFIIRQLDIKSVYNLYTSCDTMKTIILMQGVVRVCNLSLNTLSTSKSFQLDMIKSIAGHLYELNLSAIGDLRKSSLLPALNRMKCLMTLDVSYTNITIVDLLDIHKICPTIRSISINYQFDLDKLKAVTLPDDTLQECQEMFTYFTDVHFVLTSFFIYSPPKILKKSTLNTLKYTVCEGSISCLQQGDIEPLIPFNHFCMYMLDGTVNATTGNLQNMCPLTKLDCTDYIIIQNYYTPHVVWASPIFMQFFTENFNITPQAVVGKEYKRMTGNIVILIWIKGVTKYDELFYLNLKRKIKDIFICKLEISKEKPEPKASDIKNYNWISLNLTQRNTNRPEGMDIEHSFKKKRRIVAANELLDYDTLFSEHKYINLLLYFSINCVINLSANSNYLKKITYLSLAGEFFRCSKEFFNIIFRCCVNLITINIESPSLSSCCYSIAGSIPLSQSLKNIRLIDNKIDFNALFSSFNQCKKLENICIHDTSTEFNDIADPTPLYQICTNLYNIHIHAPMKNSIEKKMNSTMNSLRSPDHYVNFHLVNTYNSYGRGQGAPPVWDPYLNVFEHRLNKTV